MLRTIHLPMTAMIALLAGCSLDGELDRKYCPCTAEFSCKLDTKQCEQIASPIESVGCHIYTDGNLFCSNEPELDIYEEPTVSSPVVNRLLTTWSWFACWAPGERQADGGTTWYFTDGDVRGSPYGWLPASGVRTPAAFNADPDAYGFMRCADMASLASPGAHRPPGA